MSASRSDAAALAKGIRVLREFEEIFNAPQGTCLSTFHGGSLKRFVRATLRRRESGNAGLTRRARPRCSSGRTARRSRGSRRRSAALARGPDDDGGDPEPPRSGAALTRLAAQRAAARTTVNAHPPSEARHAR